MRSSIALLALLAPAALLAAPTTYVFDPIHTIPHFKVNHLGMTSIIGRFEKVTGKVVYDPATHTGSLDLKVPTATVTTGDPKRDNGQRSRDEHLRTPDFFNSAEFPDMTYKSTKFNFNGDKLESIDGNLTMVGVTKPLRLTVTAFTCGPHPFTKKPMCGAEAEASFKRTDFGMKFGVPAIGDEVKLMIGAEAYPE